MQCRWLENEDEDFGDKQHVSVSGTSAVEDALSFPFQTDGRICFLCICTRGGKHRSRKGPAPKAFAACAVYRIPVQLIRKLLMTSELTAPPCVPKIVRSQAVGARSHLSRWLDRGSPGHQIGRRRAADLESFICAMPQRRDKLALLLTLTKVMRGSYENCAFFERKFT